MNEHRVMSVRWTSRQRGEKSRKRIFDLRMRNYCMERRSTANLNRIQSKLTYIALNNGMTNCCKYTQLLNFIALLEFLSRKINEKFKTSLLSSFSLFFFYPPNNISSRIDHQCRPKIFNPHQCRYILRDVIWKRASEREREKFYRPNEKYAK